MQSNPANDRAAELFAKFLEDSHPDSELALETLCLTHPQEAEKVRRLFLAHNQIQQALSVFGQCRRTVKETPSNSSPQLGEVIGEFELISPIATGGQGEVWRAIQRSLGRQVALKLVRPDRINEKSLKLFAREARAGGRLAHPGIVAVYGYGQANDRHWIAQELVEGSWTLRDSIDEMRKEPSLPENYYVAVATFVAEIAEALQFAHSAGVIHRDIKPQNILVTPEDHPKVTDFGLAQITDETAVSETGDFAGTWLYMSPEQVTAKRIEVDHRTDIFSLGVVMYEMLALSRPFDGDTTHQVAENIIYREAPDLRKLKSRIPMDLAVVCGKALEKVRSSRYQTMSAFAEDLRNYLADRPINAKAPTPAQRAVKWCRRHPVLGTALASAATLLGITIVLLSVHRDRQFQSTLAERIDELRALAVLEADLENRSSLHSRNHTSTFLDQILKENQAPLSRLEGRIRAQELEDSEIEQLIRGLVRAGWREQGSIRPIESAVGHDPSPPTLALKLGIDCAPAFSSLAFHFSCTFSQDHPRELSLDPLGFLPPAPNPELRSYSAWIAFNAEQFSARTLSRISGTLTVRLVDPHPDSNRSGPSQLRQLGPAVHIPIQEYELVPVLEEQLDDRVLIWTEESAAFEERVSLQARYAPCPDGGLDVVGTLSFPHTKRPIPFQLESLIRGTPTQGEFLYCYHEDCEDLDGQLTPHTSSKCTSSSMDAIQILVHDQGVKFCESGTTATGPSALLHFAIHPTGSIASLDEIRTNEDLRNSQLLSTTPTSIRLIGSLQVAEKMSSIWGIDDEIFSGINVEVDIK